MVPTELVVVPVPVLRGPRVTLRPLRPDDRTARQRHGHHADIERNYGVVGEDREMGGDEARAWYDHHRRLATDPARRQWLVEADGDLAGEVALHSLSSTDLKARLAIGMFAPQYLGRGLGTETLRLVLAHAFGELGLHRVDLRVLDFNHAGIACYRKCGFVEEGRERESCRIGGQWYDDLIMSVLAHEFSG